MKLISLTQENGHLRWNAPALWLAYQYFHDDEASRTQVALVAEHERMRYKSLGENYETSALSAKIAEWADNKTGRLTVAGYTAIAFLLLIERGELQPSIYSAAKVVERAISNYREREQMPMTSNFFNGVWSVRDLRTPTKERDIRKAFIEFRAVAHMVAADLIAGENYNLMHIFNRTTETMATTLLTAKDVEQKLMTGASENFFDQWSVLLNQPIECENLSGFPLAGDCRAFLETGLR